MSAMSLYVVGTDGSDTAAKAAERAHDVVQAVKDVRRLNARAIGTPQVEPVLRAGLEALEHSLFAVRALFVTMGKDAPEHSTPDDGYGDEVRPALAVVLGDVADCLDAYGALVEAEAQESEAEVERSLAQSLEVAREARAILTDLLMVDAQAETSLWLLRGSTLVAVEQVLAPLNLEARARLHREQRRPVTTSIAATTLLIRDMLPNAAMPRLRSVPRPDRTASWKDSRRRVRRLRRKVARRKAR